ncbi:hypothetical protein BGZ65_009597 [Modicella reniformis]|uniref:Uncharacterized protein n=1 Tax=Modicella reniformis TaxID=1440133 RepID=A0A9P6SP91_9FUNG|nr:hypothetical protein BGZ65_009597 [Modicella reniformis]
MDNRPPPPPLPPSRRPIAIPLGTHNNNYNNNTAPPNAIALAKAHAPSPPPKPTSLSSPAPPRKPIGLSTGIGTSTPPISASRHNAAPSTSSISTSPSFPSSIPHPPPPGVLVTTTSSTSPSSISAAAVAHAATYNNNHLNPGVHSNGLSSAPGSAPTSPTTSHVTSFNYPMPGGGSSGATSAAHSVSSSPVPAHLHPSLRSQPNPASSLLRVSSTTSFVPAVASSSIAAKQHILLQQQQQQQHHLQQEHKGHKDNVDDEDVTEDPFSDIKNITAALTTSTQTPTPIAPPVPVSSPSFASRTTQNQPSLLTARLQCSTPSSLALHAPVPQHGSYPTSPRNVSSPPPLPNPVNLPPRTRSPLSGLPSQPSSGTTPVPGRQNTFSQRHSGAPPSFPGQGLAIAAPSPPVPPPPRRASMQFISSSTAQQQPRGPSPNFSAPGESGTAAANARYRNLNAPQQAFDHHSPQPKRVFSTSSSSYATNTSPVPGFGNMDSDSQSDDDGTSDDSDKDYDDVEEDHLSMTNPFAGASPLPARARTFVESSAPPPPPSRPLSKLPPPRHQTLAPDQDVAPALPPKPAPKPAVRKRPPPQQDPGSSMSLTSNADTESDTTRGVYTLQGQTGATDGIFPDYSRSNRRQPLFSDVIDIHDIQQKSHGVRTFTISNDKVATATSNIRIYSILTGENISSFGHEKETKPTVLMFTQSRRFESLGQYLWAGWSEGSLHVIDTRTKEVVEKKRAAHKGGSIIQIIRCNSQVWTVDNAGSLLYGWRIQY